MSISTRLGACIFTLRDDDSYDADEKQDLENNDDQNKVSFVFHNLKL